ncbi:hypothetical protein SDC9_159895 [bioreactor metagenome]|uniref:Uncharacterized protein n=1 Tax=bioreactor metagenome TaxID=1076179 RepID=A0A645FE44_9ZZZZ
MAVWAKIKLTIGINGRIVGKFSSRAIRCSPMYRFIAIASTPAITHSSINNDSIR